MEGIVNRVDIDHPLINSIINNDLATFRILLSDSPRSVLTAALNLCLCSDKPVFILPLLTSHAPFDNFTGVEAIRGKNPDTLILLLSPPFSMSPNGTVTSGHMTRPTEAALKLDNLRLVSILISFGANVDSREFMVALGESSLDVTEFLVKGSPDAALMVHQIGALQVAAEASNLPVVDYLVRLQGVNVDGIPPRWARGTTALMEAVVNGKADVVKYLLINMANPVQPRSTASRDLLDVARELKDGAEKEEILDILRMAKEIWDDPDDLSTPDG